jgi:hypothetical protein
MLGVFGFSFTVITDPPSFKTVSLRSNLLLDLRSDAGFSSDKSFSASSFYSSLTRFKLFGLARAIIQPSPHALPRSLRDSGQHIVYKEAFVEQKFFNRRRGGDG